MTFEILQQKHSEAPEASDDILLIETRQEVHPVVYESIILEIVKNAIKKTRGAVGPSGMDADRWRLILISGSFGNVGEDFRKSMAEITKRLCQERLANYLAGFLESRLITLDKQLGVRHIGIGEV